MKWLKGLFKYITLIFIFSLCASHVAAYQVSKTTSGAEIKWFITDVPYYVNSSGGPSGNLSEIQASMQTWTDVLTSSFNFIYSGTTTNTSYGSNDGENIVCFGSMGATGTLAENTFWFYTSSGSMIDSDIKFNTSYTWSTSGASGAYDIQNVGTHEFGHSLSLADLYNAADSEKTMYGYSSTGETKKRTLHQDDIDGITYLYPDNIPPTGTITINSGASYTTAISVTLNLSCTDTGGSCAQMRFSNDNSTWSTPETYATTKSWDLISGDGTKTVYVRYSDSSDNWSGEYSDTINLDMTDPMTTASPPGGTYSSEQNITLTCDDGAGSGCSAIYYTIDGTDPTTGSSIYSSPINIAATTTLKFFAVDVAGNQETIKTDTYEITGSLAITTSSLPSGRLDFAYSETLTASGGELPYSWSVSSGTLPNGLTLDSSSGEISGTPTATGIFDFVGQVTDSASSNAFKNLSITVLSLPVRVGDPPVYYSYIQDAYDASIGNIIEVGATDFVEDLFFDINVSIMLKGGFNSDYTDNPSYSIVNGSVTISDGTVEVENLIIQ